MRKGLVLRHLVNAAGLCLCLVLFCSRGAGQTTYNGITLTGKLIWHTYTNYGFAGVQGWMANFDTGAVYQITPPNVSGGINYHFNQNGTEVVFMGSDNNYPTQAWDIWVASVTSTGLANVTKITSGSTDGSRNEDPKFSSDGTRIIFKKNLDNIISISRSDITVNGVNQAPAETLLLASSHETSMPYYLAGSDTNFLFTDNATPNSTIRYDKGGTLTTLYAPSGLHAYYPVALNPTQFYFAQSDAAGHDQVNLGDISGDTAVAAAFDLPPYEFADPFPMGPDWLAYTSTQLGGTGSYDIWIGNFSTGETYNLNSWLAGANQTNSDLGPAFYGTISTSSGSGPSSNLALNKKASASSTLSGYPASNANNGVGSTPWGASSGTYPQWWMVDLGSKYSISQVSLNFYPATPDNWHFKIQGSMDGSTFTTVVDESKNSSSISSVSYPLSNIVARYIRIYFTSATSGQNWAALSGVSVNGTAASVSNLSLGAPASASSSYSGYPASNADDGNLNTLWDASSGSYPQWWMVDLGESHTVSQVALNFYPTTPDVWHFQIQGSTDGSTFTTLIDESNNISDISSGTYTLPNSSLRYLRVYFTSGTRGENWAGLEEVTVDGYRCRHHVRHKCRADGDDGDGRRTGETEPISGRRDADGCSQDPRE